MLHVQVVGLCQLEHGKPTMGHIAEENSLSGPQQPSTANSTLARCRVWEAPSLPMLEY